MADSYYTEAEYTELIATLDLQTKVKILTGATAFTLWPHEPIGLGELRFSDGPTGVRGLKFVGGRVVSLFPNATLLASAWNEDTAYEVGQLLAEEAAAQEIHVVLGPTINLHRTVLGGRLFEAYSEDPLLTGRLAAAYVRGLQDQGIAACLKHLIANESETDRTTVDSQVDEATLRELYMLPFEIAITDSNPWSVMAAYNDVNGIPATEQDHVNNRILKGDLAYTGLLMSDWFATKSATAAANGGLDLVMPGPDGPWGDALVQAVKAREVEVSTIDAKVLRLLRLADRTGALGELRSWPTELPAPDSAVRKEQLIRLAAGGITVLTNDGSLPLSRTQSVALIGRHAIDTIDMGGGSAKVNPPYQVTVAEGLRELLESVTVSDGVEVRERPVAATSSYVIDPVTGDQGIHITLYAEDGAELDDYSSPHAVITVGFDGEYPHPITRAVLQAQIEGVGRTQVGVLGLGSWQLRIGEHSMAAELVATGIDPGEGVLRPPSRTQDFALRGTTTIRAEAVVDPHGHNLIGLIARPAARPSAAVIKDAVAAATAADVAVVVVGLTDEQETETLDKTTLALPGDQDALVRAVAAVASKTIVVVNAATPILMPWLEEVDAVLWAGLPGQEGGHAVAATLIGVMEPSGRLVTTFPAADGAAPAWSTTPVRGALPYSEGTFIGYRGHEAGFAPEPAFWLGHGLGYSTWEYSDAELGTGDGVAPTVRVRVSNTGGRDSREVVQAYFKPSEPDQPIRLVGWSALEVAAGESAYAEIATDPRMWRRWDTRLGGWRTLASGGEILLARGLGDIRSRLELPTT